MPEQRNAVANPAVVLREQFDDWAVLFDADTGRAAGINRVGVAIWKRLDGSCSPEQIAAAFGRLYAGVPDTAAAEAREFVDALARDGFAGYEVRAPETVGREVSGLQPGGREPYLRPEMLSLSRNVGEGMPPPPPPDSRIHPRNAYRNKRSYSR